MSTSDRTWPECKISCSCNSKCIGFVGRKSGLNDGKGKCDTLLSTDKNAGSVQLQPNSESEHVCFKRGGRNHKMIFMKKR